MSLEQVRDIQGILGLRAKFVLGGAALILGIVSGLAAYLLYDQQRLLRTEMQERASSLAGNFARVCAPAIRQKDVPAVERMAAGFMSDESICFSRVLDSDGKPIFSGVRPGSVPIAESSVDEAVPPPGEAGTSSVMKDDLLLVRVAVPRSADDGPSRDADSGGPGKPKFIGEVIVGFSLSRAFALTVFSLPAVLPYVAGIAAIGLFVVIAVVARLTKPLKPLVFGAQAIALGNTAFQVPVLSRDEFGSLASSLNELARKLEEGRRKLEECNTDLDRRVRERTADLERREEELTGILENNPGGILLIDETSGGVSWANSNALKILGESLDEVGSRLPREGFPPQPERLEGVTGAPEDVYISECRLPAADGGEVPVLMSVSRISYKGRGHFQHAFFDITEYKQLEGELVQAQKMGAVGTLAGGIAHDFNNLLQAILGSVQLVLLKGDVTPQGRKLLGQVEKAVQRGADLIRQLLTFSRKVESRLRPLDLNQEVVKIVELLKRTIPKLIRIDLDLAEDLAQIDGDPLHLEQVIMNLALNARDAMPYGGTLSLHTERVVLDEEGRRGRMDLEPGEYALLRVSDTGFGMERETLEHIFEPFFTTKEVGKGTGLGLSMVYGIVKSHGGHIECTSRPGQGTSFDIFFRTATSDRGAEDQGADRVLEDFDESGTILIVDDEEQILQLGAEVLEGCGYRVLSAESGEAALEIFEAERGRIDLVILDLGMPGIGGLACFHRLREMERDVKVIIASGYTDYERRKQMLDAGAAAFVGKPYRFSELLSIVKEVLAGKQPGDSTG